MTRPPGSGRSAVRLFAVDIDGTLVGPDLEPSPAVVAALRRAEASGVAVVLATGRAYPSAVTFQTRLGLRAPVICHQGAEARGPDGEVWWRAGLEPGAVVAAGALADSMAHELTVYSGDKVYFRRADHDAGFYDRWFGLPRVRVDDWSGVPEPATKFLLVAKSQAAGDAMESAWRRAWAEGSHTGAAVSGPGGAGIDLMRSHGLFVEGVARGISKAVALAVVTRRLGLEAGNVVALGDHLNDIPMLRWAGIGVAMGGSPSEVLAAADRVAPPLVEDGAAWVVDQILLVD